MGPKDNTSKKSGAHGASSKKSSSSANMEDTKREVKLQAILLADSFSKCFRPLTHSKPKVLLPLVNVPMIDYTIEFLASNGVEELFVFCVWHATMLQEYIQNSKWMKRLSIKCITSNTCLSAGEALREIDALGIIRSDPFILISGDIISNMDLKKAIQFHKDKRKEDNNAIMTVVLKKVHFNAKIKPILDDLVVAMDSKTSQLLLFENSLSDNFANVPLEVIADHPSLKFHSDLLDCHIDVCSPELLLQFSDNFDYLDIRRHFIQNEVLNWDLGMHIFGYILENEYAARVHDPRTYHSISLDIMHRWAYPLVPDSHLLQNTSFTHSARFVYRDTQSVVSRSAKLGDSVLIGAGTVVEDRAELSVCVIGRRCRIGVGAVVTESHVWDGSVIEDGASVTHSIIGEGVVVRRNATVSRGCVLTAGVVIGVGVTVPEFSRISAPRDSDSTDGIVGADGVGVLWVYEGDDDYEVDSTGVTAADIDVLRSSTLGCVEEEHLRISRWTAMPVPTADDDNDGDSSAEEDDGFVVGEKGSLDFSAVVCDMVASGLMSNDLAENVLMEIKGFKFAQNKEFSDCINASVPPLLDYIYSRGSSKGQFVVNFKECCGEDGRGYTLLRGICQDEEDEMCLIEAIEDKCIVSPELIPMFRFILQILNDASLLTEETLLDWVSKRCVMSPESPKGKIYNRPEVCEFVEWLKADDEDDDEEEEDDVSVEDAMVVNRTIDEIRSEDLEDEDSDEFDEEDDEEGAVGGYTLTQRLAEKLQTNLVQIDEDQEEEED